MSTRLLAEIILGCVMGIALGAAIIYGLVELADYIVEQSNALYR